MVVKLKTIAILFCFTALTFNLAIAMDLKKFRETQKHPELKKLIEMYVGGVVAEEAFAVHGGGKMQKEEMERRWAAAGFGKGKRKRKKAVGRA